MDMLHSPNDIKKQRVNSFIGVVETVVTCNIEVEAKKIHHLILLNVCFIV